MSVTRLVSWVQLATEMAPEKMSVSGSEMAKESVRAG
jgi:hypothetical protein